MPFDHLSLCLLSLAASSAAVFLSFLTRRQARRLVDRLLRAKIP